VRQAATESNSFRSRVFAGRSNPLARELWKFLFKMVDLGKFAVLGKPRWGIGSIDVTCRCNLKCKHCYFLEQDYSTELTEQQWFDKFERLKKIGFPFYQCSWVGGEPMLRKSFVEKGMKYFKSNLVATNGTIPLPDWPNVYFWVSVDGTREYDTEMRGQDRYDRIIKNTNRPDLRISIAMVVSTFNYKCIDDFLAEWSQRSIKSVLFEFWTPIRGLEGQDLWLGWELRDRIIDHLLELKKKYGDFIENPAHVLRLMKSDVARSITSDCPYAKASYCFGPDGRLKRPCMMGEKADCSRCGCILPFHIASLLDKSLVLREALRGVKKVYLGLKKAVNEG